MTEQGSIIKSSRKRMIEQDIAKAICIISVLIYHIVSMTIEMRVTFFSFFGSSMIFFFMISGYNYRLSKTSYWNTIKKRFKQLILPMFKYFLVIFVVMGIYLYVRGGIKLSEIGSSIADVWVNNLGNSYFGISSTPLSRLMIPAWFLKYMISGFVIYYAVVPWAMSRMTRFYSTCAGLVFAAAIFAYFEIALPWGIHTAPAVACFMLIGTMFGQSGIFADDGQSRKWRVINALVSFAVTFTLAHLFPMAGTMAGGGLTRKYGMPEILIAISFGIFGTCWLLALGRLIAKVKILSKFMVFVGRHTLPILLLHMPISRVLKDIFYPSRPEAGGEFCPGSILICIATLIIICLGIMAFEEIKKRSEVKKKV